MKFYEMNDDYYALIKAKDKDEAIKLYDLDFEDAHLLEEISKDYAIAMYSRAPDENGKDVPIHEVLDDINNDKSMLLLIDGGLL